MRIRYAVVGLGRIAQAAILPAFARAARNSTLAALVSGDRSKRTDLADRFGAGLTFCYDEYERCLAAVDAVYIALPNSLHAEYAIRAAAAGVHVLCEKPLSVTAEEGARVVEACRAAAVTLMVAYRLHYDEMTRDVLAHVRHGDIGEPRFFESTFSFSVRPGDIRTLPPGDGGGTLHDIGVYGINAARRVFQGEPIEVTAFSVPGTHFAADELTTGILRFDGGRLATLTTSFAASSLGAYRILGSSGQIRVEPAFAYRGELAYEITTGGRVERRAFREGHQFAAELLHFSDCVIGNRPPDSSGSDALEDVRIVEALLESTATGRAVRVGP